MPELVFSSAFQKQLKKLIKQNPKLKNKTKKVFKLLIKDIRQPSLKLHKLQGENNWSVSVTYNIRMIIHMEGKQIFCLRIGRHDRVY